MLYVHFHLRETSRMSNPVGMTSTSVVAQDWGGGADGQGLSWGVERNLLKLDCGNAAWLCEYIKTTELYTLNEWTLWCVIYPSVKMGTNLPSVHHLRALVSSDVIIYCSSQSASWVFAAISDGLFVYLWASLQETLNASINCVQEYTDTLTFPSCQNAKMFHWLSCLRTKRFGVSHLDISQENATFTCSRCCLTLQC